MLGIEPTTDIKTIKRAYARQVVKFHPEEYPEEFQKIHEAYEDAVELAKAGRVSEPVPKPHTEQKTQSEEEKQHPRQELDEGERISRLAEKYEREAEKKKIHRRLLNYYLCELALSRMDRFINTKKVQSHKEWEDYLKEDIFLTAIHNAEFLLRFQRRIEKLMFWPKTVKMIKEVFYREVPEEMEEQGVLWEFFEYTGVENARKTFRKAAAKVTGGLLFACLLITGVCYGVKDMKEQSRKEEYRDVSNIEAYLEDKYQIDCTVEKSIMSGLYGLMGPITEKDNNEYFDVKINGSEGVPESFRLAWNAESEDYEEIEDNFVYETVSMYVDEAGLRLDNISAPKIVVTVDDDAVLDEVEPKIMGLLQMIQGSKVVQDGREIVIKIQRFFLYSEWVAVSIKKDEDIDQEAVRAKLKKFLEETENLYNNLPVTGDRRK